MRKTDSGQGCTKESGGEMELSVSGMTCASCVARVEKKLNKIPGISASVNLATEKAQLTLKGQAAKLSDREILEVVEKAGYGARVLNRVRILPDGTRKTCLQTQTPENMASAEETNLNLTRKYKKHFFISLLFSVPITALSMIFALQFAGWQWVSAALSLPVVLWCGYSFLRNAARALRHGSFTMDTLIALGVLSSMGLSLWALLWGGAGKIGYTMRMPGFFTAGQLRYHAHALPPVYFESAALIITFLLLGRWLESRARHTVGDSLQSLFRLGAKTVFLESRADGRPVNREVPVGEICVNDIFRVRPGEKVATDGEVIEGKSAIDCSLITGESIPVETGVGGRVTGATLNTFGMLRVRALRVGEQTALAQIGKLLAAAQTGKTHIQRMADKISAVFVPAVIILSCLTCIVRIFVFHNTPDYALNCAVTVLVIACPCALGLAVPTALLVSSGLAARRGILISGPEALETAHRINTIVLDKTGTLTGGVMEISSVIPNTQAGFTEESLLALAAGIETGSEHPIGKAILRGARQQNITPAAMTSFRAVHGSGISARSVRAQQQDTLYLAGTAEWIKEYIPEEMFNDVFPDACMRSTQRGQSSVFIASVTPGPETAAARSAVGAGVILLNDKLRPEACEFIAALKEQQIEPILASGDTQRATEMAAAQLDIPGLGRITPKGKIDLVRKLQKSGKRVAMIGDGVNDAAALAAADLSVAMGSGTDVAQNTADFIIMNSNLHSLISALRISRATRRIIRQNFAWAFGYNLIAIPLACCGFIFPSIAAAAMAASSVLVVLNSLRLKHLAADTDIYTRST